MRSLAPVLPSAAARPTSAMIAWTSTSAVDERERTRVAEAVGDAQPLERVPEQRAAGR